jgi:Secretion system C-terminal sorting domain/Cohesin domain
MNIRKAEAPMKRYDTLIIFFIISFTQSALSQVAFIVPDTRVVKENIVGAEIRLKTRDSISALQFTLEWNAAILQFEKVDSVKLPDVSMDIFGTNTTATGSLKFLWLTNAAEGVRFTDSFTIFKVFFKAIGGKGTSSMVKFTNSLIKIKALNPRVEAIATTTRDGLITIEGTSAIQNEKNTEGVITLYQNFPNPVSNQTTISFELNEADNITCQVYDSIGRLVIEKHEFYFAGKHEWRLDTEGVLRQGMYRYGIRTKSQFVSKTLLKL